MGVEADVPECICVGLCGVSRWNQDLPLVVSFKRASRKTGKTSVHHAQGEGISRTSHPRRMDSGNLLTLARAWTGRCFPLWTFRRPIASPWSTFPRYCRRGRLLLLCSCRSASLLSMMRFHIRGNSSAGAAFWSPYARSMVYGEFPKGYWWDLGNVDGFHVLMARRVPCVASAGEDDGTEQAGDSKTGCFR